MSWDERVWGSVKFEQISLFYPRGCAPLLRRIASIATLERFVVYCSCEQINRQRPLARPRGHGELLKLLWKFAFSHVTVRLMWIQDSGHLRLWHCFKGLAPVASDAAWDSWLSHSQLAVSAASEFSSWSSRTLYLNQWWLLFPVQLATAVPYLETVRLQPAWLERRRDVKGD